MDEYDDMFGGGAVVVEDYQDSQDIPVESKAEDNQGPEKEPEKSNALSDDPHSNQMHIKDSHAEENEDSQTLRDNQKLIKKKEVNDDSEKKSGVLQYEEEEKRPIQSNMGSINVNPPFLESKSNELPIFPQSNHWNQGMDVNINKNQGLTTSETSGGDSRKQFDLRFS